jgi:MFS superfamily sulfate permease-like transporter
MAGLISSQFTPKIFSMLKSGYGKADFRSDVLAGLTVAIVALPPRHGAGDRQWRLPR